MGKRRRAGKRGIEENLALLGALDRLGERR
jgi:hypothetical protein